MAQGIVRALRSVGDTPAEQVQVERSFGGSNEPLVPTAKASVRRLRSRFDGQQLAGSGALVWEGEVLDRPAVH